MQSLGLRSKNDNIDASGLSRMRAEQTLDLWKPLSKNIYVLRSLTRHLENLQKPRVSFNNQLHACKHSMYNLKDVEKGLKKSIRAFDKQIEAFRER